MFEEEENWAFWLQRVGACRIRLVVAFFCFSFHEAITHRRADDTTQHRLPTPLPHERERAGLNRKGERESLSVSSCPAPPRSAAADAAATATGRSSYPVSFPSCKTVV